MPGFPVLQLPELAPTISVALWTAFEEDREEGSSVDTVDASTQPEAV